MVLGRDRSKMFCLTVSEMKRKSVFFVTFDVN